MILMIILYKLGLLQKYEIECNDFHHQSRNKIIEFYYIKNCPRYFLKEAALVHLRKKVTSCVGNLILLVRIDDWLIDEQFKY